jgi:(p)ppGpp synthase/HD superfamily hydrolase
MTDLELVTKAANYAAKAHREHRRKDSAATPYINHLTEVAYLLAGAGCPATVIAAGYLHDTIEDVDVTYEMLLDEFGEEIAALVLTVTDDKHLSNEERKQRQVDNATHAPADTAALKLADKMSNLRSLVKSPPHGWSPARLIEYVDWAHRVVTNLPEPNAILLAQYELVRADLLRRWS